MKEDCPAVNHDSTNVFQNPADKFLCTFYH